MTVRMSPILSQRRDGAAIQHGNERPSKDRPELAATAVPLTSAGQQPVAATVAGHSLDFFKR
jgi:hypothetical protein